MITLNNGSNEQEKLQNRFTALVSRSMSRAKIDYIRKEECRNRFTCVMEDEKMAFIPDETDFISNFCESDALSFALSQLEERERYVLFARVLEERDFEEIADKLGLKYKGVTALYYRTVAKLRELIGGN